MGVKRGVGGKVGSGQDEGGEHGESQGAERHCEGQVESSKGKGDEGIKCGQDCNSEGGE